SGAVSVTADSGYWVSSTRRLAPSLFPFPPPYGCGSFKSTPAPWVSSATPAFKPRRAGAPSRPSKSWWRTRRRGTRRHQDRCPQFGRHDMAEAKSMPPRWDRSRFYTIDGRQLPSVTSILDIIAKPGLAPWYAKQERQYFETAMLD